MVKYGSVPPLVVGELLYRRVDVGERVVGARVGNFVVGA